jgi:hypothetical protein
VAAVEALVAAVEALVAAVEARPLAAEASRLSTRPFFTGRVARGYSSYFWFKEVELHGRTSTEPPATGMSRRCDARSDWTAPWA